MSTVDCSMRPAGGWPFTVCPAGPREAWGVWYLCLGCTEEAEACWRGCCFAVSLHCYVLLEVVSSPKTGGTLLSLGFHQHLLAHPCRLLFLIIRPETKRLPVGRLTGLQMHGWLGSATKSGPGYQAALVRQQWLLFSVSDYLPPIIASQTNTWLGISATPGSGGTS